MAPKLYQNTTLETIFSPTEPPQIQAKVDEEQNFDIPLSKEEKPEAYPDGPICVHEPYIDLYLEPTAEQARQYDVVMNVAVEVRNPLDPLAEPKSPEPEVRLDGGGGIQYAPKRDNLPRPLEQRQPSSPTTPRATPSSLTIQPQATLGTGAHDPEYIHIPWEHNSDIVPDLLRLVKLIDERVTQKKRVLVHCQCGVSRSASLVVAYGLYKDPSLSVQEAYDAVKARSKWIGPNMVRLADVLKLDFPADKSTEFHHATARVQVKPRPWRPASREPRFVANHSCFRAQRVAQSFLGTIDRDWTSLCGSLCWICQPEPTYP
jgi:tyrosine-protein phosphatase